MTKAFTWNKDLEGPALRIAETEDSPLRVLAGPGTGKSFSLMRRITRLLEQGTDPKRILLCTFTRSAAKDLLSSLQEKDMPVNAPDIETGTIHSLCFKIIAGKSAFAFSGRKIRPMSRFEVPFLREDLKCKDYGGLNGVKKLLIKFSAAWSTQQNEDPAWPYEQIHKRFQSELEEWLEFHKSMLLEELVPETLRYLKYNPHAIIFDAYDYVLIDEFQDLNRAEQDLILQISKNAKLTIVGDEDQSIYSFKYAFPEGIAKFHVTHIGTHDETLDKSRRCSEPIISMANTLIQNNSTRTNRSLVPFDPSENTEVVNLQWSSYRKEISGISRIIQKLIKSGRYLPEQILLIAPNKHYGFDFSKEFALLGVPFLNLFQESVLFNNPKDSEESKPLQALSLLNLLLNSTDRVSLRCLMGYGEIDLLKKQWRLLMDYCYQNVKDPFDVLEEIANGNVVLSTSKKLKLRYASLKDKLLQLRSCAITELVDDLFPVDQEWADCFRKKIAELDSDLLTISTINEQLHTWLEQPEVPASQNTVKGMTLFKSKGLTYDVVVITGLVKGLIPQKPKKDLTKSEADIQKEEQRRMFYVGITRAKEMLILSNFVYIPTNQGSKMYLSLPSNNGYMHCETSNFISEFNQSCPVPVKGEDYLELP